MDKKEIKDQLREICTAANSLAGALCSLQVRLSADIMLDDAVEKAEAKGDDISHQVKKLVDDFYATHDKAARWRIAEHILLSVFGLAPEELNGIMKKEALNLNSVISAIQNGNKEATHHCGQDTGECKVSCGDLEATVPCKDLLGMQVVSAGGSETRCVGCPQENDSCFKVELVGGDYLCLAVPEQDKEPITGLDEDERKVFEHNGMCDMDRRVNERNSLTYQDAFSDAVRDIKANGATNHSCPFAVLQAQREIKDAETIKRMHGVSKALTDWMYYR